jgi:SSS family solute:Na+ symporter
MQASAIQHGQLGLQWIDWIVIVLYLGGVLALGSYFSKRQSTTAEYFIAARTHIHPVLVGISLYAALLSTISYLGKPGEMINKGPMLLIGQILSIPFAYALVGYWIIPKIMQQRVTSAYELLELRLGLTGRLLGALLFLSLRLVWMGLLIYLAATALAVIVNVDLKWVPLVAVVVGFIPLVYSSVGGLRAVVLADVSQFSLLLLGAVLTIAIVTVRCGGFSWWPTKWSPYWDVQPFFSLDPKVRVTVVGAVLNMLIWRVCTAGGDQMAIQRYMATRDVTAARRSYLVTSIATIVVTVVLAVLGLALLGFFTQFPELLGPGMTLQKNADHVFPYFIANLLPVGVSGLVVAAILAASSNVDSGVTAVTAVVMKDFFERFGWKPASEQRRLRVTKCVSFAIGGAVVGASMVMGKVPGNFMEVTNKTANLEVTPIFGLFFLALFVRSATPLSAVVGTAYGLTAAVSIAFWDVFTGHPPISFQYIGIIGLICNLVAGYLVSRYGPRREDVRATFVAGAVLLALLAVAVVFIFATLA